MKRWPALIWALLAALPSAAVAQPNAASGPAASGSAASGSAASSDAGRRIATQGAPNVAPCASCHGASGEGNAAGGFPRIAGQSAGYLHRQLEAYASDSRQNPVMGPIAKALDAAQRRAVSDWYAHLGNGASTTATSASKATAAAASGAAAAASAPSAQALQRGARLAAVGDESLKVQACANCHGQGGVGQAPDYPYLAGQHGGYLSAALAEWKSGARKTDPTGQMVQIAQALRPADVAALSAFFASRPVPPPRVADVATPWVAPRATVVVSGPRKAAAGGGQQAQGVGTEQGAPLTGGGQGPGGGGAATGGGAQGSSSGNSETGAPRR